MNNRNFRYEERLGQENLLPLIFRMALPAITAQFVNLLYNMVDRIYIGHIPGIGTDALAGVGVTTSIIILIASFSAIVGGGGAPLAAIALGQGDRERAGKILGNGFLLLILFTLCTSSTIYVFMEPVLRFAGASENTLSYATDYLSIYLLGTLFVEMATGLNSFINIQGRPTVSMFAVLTGAILNIILDPIFIFWLDFGVRGAAIATVLSQMGSAVCVLGFLCSHRASLPLEKRHIRPDFRIVFGILALGASPFVMASTESLVGFALNGHLKMYGDIYVSFNLALILVMMLFPATIARAFTSDAALIETVSWTMPIFLGGMSIFGLQRACQNMFVSLGQARISIFIALLRKVILLIPLTFLLSRLIGVTGVYAAEAIADGTAAICCTLIFIWQFPKILRKAPQRIKS